MLNIILIGLPVLSKPIDSLNFTLEKVYLISDRDVYCVNETVQIKICFENSLQTVVSSWSNIIYCELITPDGRSVAKNKFLVKENCADGTLKIPQNAVSGNYYLRAYTKWMRNQSPYSFNYKRIKIINPYNSEVLPNLIDSEYKIKIINLLKEQSDFLTIIKPDSTFLRNQKVSLQIKAINSNFNQGSLTFSVVKKGTNNSDYIKFYGFDEKISEVKYIPETRGVSLSGKVVNKSDSIPVPYENLWITLMKEKPFTNEVLTDATGNFYIDLGTEKGKFDLFIQANTFAEGKIEPLVLVDNDFLETKMNLPFIPFEVNDSELELYETLIVNSQLKNIFMSDKNIPDSIKLSFDGLFYSKPEVVINFDNYIEMPDVEDYVREFLPNIRIRKDRTKRFLKFYKNNPDMGFYDPLVMLNLIKYNDAERILKLSPRQIDRIEIIESPFLRGDMIYGGIIHFITKSADFKNFIFPDKSIFVEYEMIQKNEPIINQEDNSTIPIIGNCLYWNPSINLSNGGETTLHFNAGSEIGDYEIVIEGLDKENQPFQVRDSFTVK